jgi:predicted Zn-dependent protease with MMP-like domain
MLACRALDRALPPVAWALPREQFERSVARALQGLPPERLKSLDGAIVVVDDSPGVEAVVDGIDPRAPVLIEGVGDDAQPDRPGRVFVYQRNLERGCGGVEDLDDELAHTLAEELEAATTRAVTPRPPPEPRRQPQRAPGDGRERANDDDRTPPRPRKKSN